MTYKNILLTTDFSEANKAIALKAEQLAKESKAVLYVTTILDTEHFQKYTVGYAWDHKFNEHLIEHTEKMLAEYSKLISVPVDCQILAIGPIKHQIPRIITDYSIDLVIAGSHSGAPSWLIGSNTNAIINAATCHVLVMKEGK